jgi:hypothetical protein
VTLGPHTETVRAGYDALAPSFGQWDEVVPMLEPGVPTSFLWVLARNPV